MAEIIARLDQIAERYDALFCDLWGCVHNGLRAFPAAVSALQAFRARGGSVVLVTNAPRPRAHVAEQLDRMGVPRDAWDVIATSGDSARAAMFEGVAGRRVWFMGEERDRVVFGPMKLFPGVAAPETVALEEAEGIVCCGPFDPMADPSVLRPELHYARRKDLPLLCFNPDIVVDRGDAREWCAGAIAKLYTDMGGRSLYFGKPHPPIYDLARRRLAALGRNIPDDRILAVGDGIVTDVMGALGEGIDVLFVSGGLAAAETRTGEHPDADALKTYLETHQMAATYAIGYLR